VTNARYIGLARAQHGAVTTAQLLNAGVSERALATLVRKGWLRRVHRGVYIVGALETPLTRPSAALLACGPAAVLSHRTAAVVWELLDPRPDDPVQVTLLNAHRRHPQGVEIHRTTHAPTRYVQRLRITDPVRTLEDLDGKDFDRALNEAQVRRLITHREVSASRRLSDAVDGGATMTRSEAERRLLRILRRAGLPAPRTNVRVHGHEVDLYWPEHRLVVEFDGWAYHSTRAAFERDRLKDADLMLHGERVMRVTDRQLGTGQKDLKARFANALEAFRPPPPPLVN
jgi:very-short-patch-repair endonuclease